MNSLIKYPKYQIGNDSIFLLNTFLSFAVMHTKAVFKQIIDCRALWRVLYMTKAFLVPNKQNNIDLLLHPIKGGTSIYETTIDELASASKYTDLYINRANIRNAIEELSRVLKPLQNNEIGREISYQILERRDASISIKIHKDEMTATAEITTAVGGKHLTAKAIYHAAQQAGVEKGFDREELVNLARQAAQANAGTIVEGQIAFGKGAVNGKDGKIEYLVENSQNRILKPKERTDGSVDMRDLGDVICVKVGDPLAKRHLPTVGIKGFSITGTSLQPIPGKSIQLKVGKGTSLNPENDNCLIAANVGLPRFNGKVMDVDDVLRIKNVDVSTGHILFEGSVIITGNVCEGMKVTASGDILVNGFIESARLDSGGDITIVNGIIGKKQDVENMSLTDITLSVQINAKGKIYAKYCQYAEIACQNLRIENQMMHSIINVEEKLWLGSEKKANGKLIAGFITVGTSIHAGTVGSTAGSKTIVTFSKNDNNFNEAYKKIKLRIKEDSAKIIQLKNLHDKINIQSTGNEKAEMLNKVLLTYQFHEDRIFKLKKEKKHLEEKINQYMSSVYFEANEKIYQSVQVIVGDFQEKTKREYGPSIIRYKERKVRIEPLFNTGSGTVNFAN